MPRKDNGAREQAIIPQALSVSLSQILYGPLQHRTRAPMVLCGNLLRNEFRRPSGPAYVLHQSRLCGPLGWSP